MFLQYDSDRELLEELHRKIDRLSSDIKKLLPDDDKEQTVQVHDSEAEDRFMKDWALRHPVEYAQGIRPAPYFVKNVPLSEIKNDIESWSRQKPTGPSTFQPYACKPYVTTNSTQFVPGEATASTDPMPVNGPAVATSWLEPLRVKVRKLHEDATLPMKYGSSPYWCLYCAYVTNNSEDGIVTYHTGLSVEVPDGYVGLVLPLADVDKQGLTPVGIPILVPGVKNDVTFQCRWRKLPEGIFHPNYKDVVARLLFVQVPNLEMVEAL